MTDLDGVKPTHRHKKRGSEYVLLGIGRMQAEDWFEGPHSPDYVFEISVDMREVAIYRSVDDGALWVRPREEFEDGRFEALSPAPEAPGAGGAPAPALGSGETEWIGDFLNRRTDVEKVLRDVKRGKRQALSPEECWELADRLSVPANHGGA